MKKLIERCILTLGVAGMVLPQQAFAAQPVVAQQAASVDVKLNNGALAGRVISSAGQPAATTVAVFQGSKLVSKTTSAADGSYRVAGLKAGTYTVATPAGAGQVRAWDGIAPPTAVETLALVDGSAVRAQCDSACDGAGCGVGGGGCGGGNTLCLIAAAGGVTAAVLAGLAYSEAQDNSDDISDLRRDVEQNNMDLNDRLDDLDGDDDDDMVTP